MGKPRKPPSASGALVSPPIPPSLLPLPLLQRLVNHAGDLEPAVALVEQRLGGVDQHVDGSLGVLEQGLLPRASRPFAARRLSRRIPATTFYLLRLERRIPVALPPPVPRRRRVHTQSAVIATLLCPSCLLTMSSRTPAASANVSVGMPRSVQRDRLDVGMLHQHPPAPQQRVQVDDVVVRLRHAWST